MIGQKFLQKTLVKETNHSIILVGEAGSGKTEMGQYFATFHGADFICVDKTNMEKIRQIITDSMYAIGKKVYCFEKMEQMSVRVQNALLKTLEEGNGDDYFIFCTEDIEKVVPTIKSRSAIYNMQPYSREELIKYSDTRCGGIDIKFCRTPGEIQYKKYLIETGNHDKLLDLAKNIYENIDRASVGNVFNILTRMETCGELNKQLILWLINILLYFYKYDYEFTHICLNYKYHIMYNNTDFKRTFEQMLVVLNSK